MATEKIIQTRILNKIDTLENWNKSTLKIKQGEICLATIAASAGVGLEEPVVMAKIGTAEEKTFAELPWSFYAKSADVLAACKSEAGLRTFINGVIADAGIASNDAMEVLAGRVTNTETAITTLNGDENTAGSVAKAIKDAIDALNLADTYVAKEGYIAYTQDEKDKLEGISTGANKVEVETENAGKIKIDGVEKVIYTHPDKHAIADVAGLQDALDGKQAAGDYAAEVHTHVKDDITDFAHNHEMSEVNGLADALAGKQDVIPENTYDAHGTAAQALTDAKAYVDEEDIFVTDMKTINALGGIAAGSDLNNLTTHEVLKKLLYPYVDATVGNATASPNGGTYEKGATKTITSVSISVTKKSEPITSVALYNGSTLIEEKTGDAVKNGGTITFSGLSVEVPTNGNQLTVKVTYPDANGAVKTVEKKTTALTFVYPYYMGTCAAGTAIDETLVESLTKKIEGKGNKSNSFTVSDGHMVFAYPKAHGVLKSILDPNNFETIGNYTRSEVSVTGLDGTAQAYYVYVSGATTVSGFVVNFKY